MKPRVKVKVQFGKAARPAAPEPERVPRVTRLVALAHYLDEKIRAGEIEDLATAAQQAGLTRARVTQVMNLLLLAPTIQEALLAASQVEIGRDVVTERGLRPIVAEAVWSRQEVPWLEWSTAALSRTDRTRASLRTRGRPSS